MPELPEVETSRRGIAPHVMGRRIVEPVIRQRLLRWPIAEGLEGRVSGNRITGVGRRAKYLLLGLDSGSHLILHLGMSGSLRILPATTPAGKHDHVDLRLDNGHCLRLTDPRRFGALLLATGPIGEHPLLRDLGPEPLLDDFNGDYLFERSRRRKTAIKSFLMDARAVVGVGNIYANEALFMAGIHPARAAGSLSRQRCTRLVAAVRSILRAAIEEGGTTLRDFVGSGGQPGYFAQQLAVYGREGAPCPRCRRPIRLVRINQRSTYYCAHCQR